jgi:hypothetical protein
MAFDVFLQQRQEGSPLRRRRAATWLVSLALHAGGLLALGVHSFWGVEEISPGGVGVTFLSVGTPPVPPPPVAIRKTRPQARPSLVPVATVKAQLLSPREGTVRDPRTFESDTEAGYLETEAGGVASPSVENAGLRPTERAGAPIIELLPVMLGPNVGVSQRISDLSDLRFRPTLPPALNRPGFKVSGVFEICVSVAGQVNDVKVLRSADPLVDGDWTTVIRRWQYRPFTLKGRPTPFCYPLMLEVQSMRG